LNHGAFYISFGTIVVINDSDMKKIKVHKKYFKISLLSLGLLGLLIQYNNCSEVEFSSEKSLAEAFEVRPVDIDIEHEDEIRNIIANCQNSTQINLDTTLLFPKQVNACEWGASKDVPSSNGNYAKQNSYFQARREQEAQLELPVNAVICDMQFNSVESELKYDDHFLISMNDLVLMSTYKGFVLSYTQADIDIVNAAAKTSGGYLEQSIPPVLLSTLNGHYVYNWSDIGHSYWFGGNNWKDPGYCLGSNIIDPDTNLPVSTCSWPETENIGTVDLNIHPAMIKSIMAFDVNRNIHNFKMIVTGDNDSSDCKHNSDLSFNLNVKYIIRE
jgi:hypothetical protein